jgi:hypothetical protein
MKVRVVPAEELDPKKGLAARDYIADGYYSPDKRAYCTVRIVDNVLTSGDFGLYRVHLFEERITGLREMKPGVCAPSLQLGQPLRYFFQWLQYDPTGCHPEVYHQVYDQKSSKWVDMIGQTMADLTSILSENIRRSR